MKNEILIAVFQNFTGAFTIVSGICMAAFFTISIFYLMSEIDVYHDDDRVKFVKDKAIKNAKLGSISLFSFILFLSVPNINDIWKVRIALIKFELSDPENIKKASETIERIGKKLECKYLGCKEEKSGDSK